MGKDKKQKVVTCTTTPNDLSQLLVVNQSRKVENEVPEISQLPPYIALSKLKARRGDRYSLERLLARLSLGRIIAHYHFKEPLGEHIHEAVGRVIRCAQSQDESDQMHMVDDDIEYVCQCLNAIDQMQREISQDDYTVCFFRFSRFELNSDPATYSSRNLLPWTRFKSAQGWL
jgi:hypothetical protein